MGSEYNIISNILKEDLYKYSIKYGPNQEYSKRFPYIDVLSPYINAGPKVVPDKIYRPKIMVTIDFTHKFVLKERTPSGDKVLEGKRPLPKDLLEYYANKLLNYFSYYFEKTLSYSKGYDHLKLQNVINKVKNADEWGYNVFINEIINFFLTSIQVNRVRNGIGTSVVSLKDTPAYYGGSQSKLLFDQSFNILNQLFVPMLPLKVWARGRFYTDFFFPIFDGFTVANTEKNDSGFYSVDIYCKDYLELARNSYEMINPAIMQIEEFKKQESINIYSRPLYKHDHFKIFKALFLGGKLTYNPEDPNKPKIGLDETISSQKGTHNFSSLGSLEDASENGVVPPYEIDTRYNEARATSKASLSIESALKLTSHIKTPRRAVSWGESITPYRLLQFQSVQPYTSEFQNRLDVMKEVASLVYYELYVDPWGNIQYHPMRFSNKYFFNDIIYLDSYLGVEVKHPISFPGIYTISPEEMKGFSRVLNVEELVTHLRLKGIFPFEPGEAAENVNLVASYYDEKYMQRFGYRRREVTNPMFNKNGDVIDNKTGKKEKILNVAARELSQYMNGELYTMEASIVFRPELQVAMPVLLMPQLEAFYINNISHSVTIGGDATTTINASFGRYVEDAAIDIASVMLDAEKLYKVNKSETEAELAVSAARRAAKIQVNEAQQAQEEKAKSKKNKGSKNKTKKGRKKKGDSKRESTKDSRGDSAFKKNYNSLF